MEIIEPYAPGAIALLIFILIVLVQGALVGAGKAKANVTPGAQPDADYELDLYRSHRSHQNGAENIGAITATLVVCILVGVSAWWVNLLMGLYLVFRVIYVFVYAQNIGSPAQSVRTFVYVAGWAMNVILIGMAIWKLAF